jgi:hypothetical protein
MMVPAELQAKPKRKYRGGNDHHSHYYSYPRTGFSLSFGTGYAGRGYYYGPPGVPYFYERPGVTYYRDRASVPRSYYGGGGGYYDRCADVQRILYRGGYYGGAIDGVCGPGTRSAIIRYRSRHGLAVTGVIDRSLLVTMGLW